jgi:hypothetical protein
VCHCDLFETFFALAVGEGDLSQAELDRLRALTCNRNGFITECRALVGRGLLDVAFERLDAYKDQIPLEHMPVLLRALCDIADEFPEPKPDPFQVHVGIYARRLVHFGLRQESDQVKRLAILKEAFADTRGLLLPLEIVAAELRASAGERADANPIVDQAGLDELKRLCVAKLKAASRTVEFEKARNLATYLVRWFNWGDQVEVREWVARRVQDTIGAFWILRALLGTSSATGPQGTVVCHHIDLGFVQQFADVNRLAQLTALAKAEDLAGLDRTALTEFRKALKRRADGLPDNDWS